MPELSAASACSERNPRDEVATEAVLELLEDLLVTVADDLAQPNAAIHCNEERAFAQPRGLGMTRDVGINQVIPDPQHLSLAAASVNAKVVQNLRQDLAGASAGAGSRFFKGGKV